MGRGGGDTFRLTQGRALPSGARGRPLRGHLEMKLHPRGAPENLSTSVLREGKVSTESKASRKVFSGSYVM